MDSTLVDHNDEEKTTATHDSWLVYGWHQNQILIYICFNSKGIPSSYLLHTENVGFKQDIHT
jgi:hypothetical protein